MAKDLFIEAFGGNSNFIDRLSVVSSLPLLRMRAPLSVDIDLLTGGEGDLGLPEHVDLSSGRKDNFGSTSLSVNLEGRRYFLCLPEEQLLI